MRSFRGLSLCLLLLGGLFAQTANPCSTASGVNSEALKWLGNTGVYLNNDLDFTDTTSCKGAFKTAGSCCDKSSLVTKINSLHSRMITKWQAYMDKLQTVRKFLPGLNKLANLMTVALINSKVSQLNTVGAAIKLNDFLSIVPRDEKSINALKKFITDYENNLADFNYYGQTCFETLRNARANIYCAACAGNAADFASPQSEFGFRYRVTPTTCRVLVDNCFPVFRFNFLLVSAIQTMVVLKARALATRARVLYRSDANLSSDVLASLFDTFVSCSTNYNTQAMTCGNDSELEKFRTRICTMGFMANKHIGFLEGDPTISSDLDGVNLDTLVDVEAVQNKRLLQQTFEPVLGISPGAVGTSFPHLLNSDTGLIPEGSIDSAAAGLPPANTSGASLLVSLTIGLLLIVV